MRHNDRARSLCKSPFVCHLDFNTSTQCPVITRPALMFRTCWSLCHLCSLTKASSFDLSHSTRVKKVPPLILWRPLCLCPCEKQLRLLPLARILAKYWWLPVETRPVKTIWEETSVSRDDSRAKQNHRQCGGIRTQPNLPTSRERRQHQKDQGNRQIVSNKSRGQRGCGPEICTVLCGFTTLICNAALFPSCLTCVRTYCPWLHWLTELKCTYHAYMLISVIVHLQANSFLTCL